MNRFVILLACTAGAGLTIAACGGIGNSNDLFGGGGAGAAGTATSGTGTGTGTTGTGNGGPGSTTGTAATTSGTAATTSGTAATTTSATTTSATTTSSSSSGLPAPHVPCGGMTGQPPQECAVGQICCFDTTGFDDQCGDPGSCGSGFIEISCNGPEACPGEVCCGSVDFGMQEPYLGISCQPTCDDPNSQIVLCGMNNQASQAACPPNTMCQASQVLDPGYFICNP